VRLAQGRRHDRFGHLLAEQLVGPVPEDPRGGGVDVGDASVLVDAEDAVMRRLQDRSQPALAGGQFRRASLGDLPLARRLLGGQARGQIGALEYRRRQGLPGQRRRIAETIGRSSSLCDPPAGNLLRPQVRLYDDVPFGARAFDRHGRRRAVRAGSSTVRSVKR
jgi:hypothetical protein